MYFLIEHIFIQVEIEYDTNDTNMVIIVSKNNDNDYVYIKTAYVIFDSSNKHVAIH